jgi:hypothetical protein
MRDGQLISKTGKMLVIEFLTNRRDTEMKRLKAAVAKADSLQKSMQ